MSNRIMLRYISPVTGVLLCIGCTTNGTRPSASLQNQIENLEQPRQLPKQSAVGHFAACMESLLAAQLGALNERMPTDENPDYNLILIGI